MTRSCPFCELIESQDKSRLIVEDGLAVAVYDGYPVSQGHTLIIPKRHIPSFFQTSERERQQFLSLLNSAKAHLESQYSPDGYNIGINDGLAAGQTVNHLHIHLIPRYVGDLVDPRGGVRWVLPDKADYWSSEK